LLDYLCAAIFFHTPKKAAAVAFVANARPDGLDSNQKRIRIAVQTNIADL
jgi:hypothetical protein